MANLQLSNRKVPRKKKCRLPLRRLLVPVLFVIVISFSILGNIVLFVTKTEGDGTIFASQQQAKGGPLHYLKPPIVGRKKGKKEVGAKSKPPLGKNITPKNIKSSISTIHVVFSTSCHEEQSWQSYLFFYQAMIKKQYGTVTRIVSGCDQDQEAKVTKEFNEHISTMSNYFKIHFTPEYGRLPRQDYSKTKYWNKPFGLKHWLESQFGYDFEGGVLSTSVDEDIIVLVDPDMLIQRPFDNHFPEYMPDLWIGHVYKNGEPISDKVSHGKPFGQSYSFGAAWLKQVQSDLSYIVGPNSPVHNVTDREARKVFSAGPPYIATSRDMYQLSYHWVKFLPRIFHITQDFMSEMYGYCMAAAHLRLEHQLAKGFMISDPKQKNANEGWRFMEHVTETICNVSQFNNVVPHVIHYCQQYSIGEFRFSKYNVPTHVFSCDFPMLETPLMDVASYVNYSYSIDASVKVWLEEERWEMYRNAFMICSLIPSINGAATYFKNHNCLNGANYSQTQNTLRTRRA